MNKKFVCIHGHFYQPPRENAWIEEIEVQDSAAPFHDWNERITQECYGPNSVARILDKNDKIVDIVSNYAHMSFNFGPTLLSWLELKSPKVYQAILDADRESMIHFNGHGSAMAQVYNHIIMPLANRRDKATQVYWGIYDFKKRFGRMPEGMWLAETAVDTETLEVMAEQGIKFTVLAPYQAKKFRKMGAERWKDGIDITKPYLCNLPSGKTINLFFYDGPHSQGVAFNGYLNDGRHFADSLISAFEDTDEPQLVHIATDGESYGHHHKNGEMALAYAIDHISRENDISITNYSQYLEMFPPEHEVEINDNTSWSCAHGIERWRSDCGCHTGGREGWTQKWRVGLRVALDSLRDRFAELFEETISAYHPDPWRLRNEYIEVLFKRSEQRIEKFLETHISHQLPKEDKVKIIRMLEMQKQSLYMFTSCGWFFNDVSGLETTQILQYANRGIQLAEETLSVDLETTFKDDLAISLSNYEEYGSAKDIYEKWVVPQRLSLTQVGMHYAVNSLFEDEEESLTVLNYDCRSQHSKRLKAGTLTLVSGMTYVKSRVTLSSKKFSFAVVYMGNHHLIGGTSNNVDEETFFKIEQKLEDNFQNSNLAGILYLINDNFSDRMFSFFQLFKDQQLKLLNHIMTEKVEGAISSFEKIYDSSYPLINVMKTNGLSIPGIMENNLTAVFQYKLEEIFEDNHKLVQIPRLKRYTKDVLKWNAKIKKDRISYLASIKISEVVDLFSSAKDKSKLLENLIKTIKLLKEIDIHPNIEELQNFVFTKLKEQDVADERLAKARELAELINLKV